MPNLYLQMKLIVLGQIDTLMMIQHTCAFLKMEIIKFKYKNICLLLAKP